MSPNAIQISLLIAMWIGYFVVHSLLAAHKIKQAVYDRWPRVARRYRLLYNLVALLLLIPPLALTYSLQTPRLWEWEDWQQWLADSLAVMAILGFVYSLRGYSGMDFLGLAQLRSEQSTTPLDTGELRISFLHRFVRHPWYFFTLVIIWTRDMNVAFLVTSVLVTLYFLIGSWLEEQKLIQQFGARYQDYRARVPGLVPRPWKFLSRADTETLNRK